MYNTPYNSVPECLPHLIDESTHPRASRQHEHSVRKKNEVALG